MSDFDEEIEFLDEDADIVQQCVIPVIPSPDIPCHLILKRPSKSDHSRSLLTERKPVTVTSKRQKEEIDDDEDYDPSKDPDFNHFIKKKPQRPQPNVVKKPSRLVNPSTSEKRIEQAMMGKFQLDQRPQPNILKKPYRLVNPPTSEKHIEQAMMGKFQSGQRPQPNILKKPYRLVNPPTSEKHIEQATMVKFQSGQRPQPNILKKPYRLVNPPTSEKHIEQATMGKFQSGQPKVVKLTDRMPLKTTFAQIENKTKHDVRIFNYQDSICMQDKPLTNCSEYDKGCVKEWNKLCLEQMTKYEEPLTTDEIKCSQRTMIFKNVRSKHTGKVEPSVYSQLTVQNPKGLETTEAFKSVLPNFQNKRGFQFDIGDTDIYRVRRSPAVKNCVLLTKEEHNDGEALVAFKTADCTVSTYKLVEKSDDEDVDNEILTYLEEKVQSKICCKCYQYSWRGVKVKSKINNIQCPICDRVCTNMYNLLLHIKTHKDWQVKNYQEEISKVLSEMVDYHYKCRICLRKMSTVKGLRKHVNEHKGSETFLCEVGNHYTA